MESIFSATPWSQRRRYVRSPPVGLWQLPNKDNMNRTVCVFNRNRESFLALRVVPTDTFLLRLAGLLGRMRLKPEDGIWLVPCRGIHTIGMPFAVDLIYLDSANRVIHLVEHLGPSRIAPIRLKCTSILELHSRAIYSSNTQIGDQLLICTPEEMKAHCEKHQEAAMASSGVSSRRG